MNRVTECPDISRQCILPYIYVNHVCDRIVRDIWITRFGSYIPNTLASILSSFKELWAV